MEEEKKWFRLSGGKRYGYNRLGYLIGKEFISDSVQKLGINETFIIWAKNDIRHLINEWLIYKKYTNFN
ncbi:hypothetical protein ACQKM9_20280 [Viridibacillus sp. NPDC093762]|uniref:hypothetical protein n=1 Tax=Viridibacillus sp. NPDC093762 TaxID=3390720 RepID=UPI003CFE1398